MTPKWNVEELESFIESRPRFGHEQLVGDTLDVFGDLGNVAMVYFHFESTSENPDLGDYSFTFNKTYSLEENLEDLWKTVKGVREIPR